MKEVTFIRQNISKWRGAELVVETIGDTDATELADTYIDVTSDLAFAQTHYPESKITRYLNNLASALHNEIFRSHRYRWSRLLTYWTQDVPLTMWEARRELLLSFIVFTASVFIGFLSQLLDPEFCRIILGDRYVDMTLQNIASGEPMAVYSGNSEGTMFGSITMNNVMVSFVTFALGIFTSLGTGFKLFQNGVMLGSFQPARTAVGVGFGCLAARHIGDFRHYRGWSRRHGNGQRMVVPRHLSADYIIPSRGTAGAAHRGRHGAGIHRGRLHRKLLYPAYRVARPAETEHHPRFVSICHLLLYCITQKEKP